QALFFIQAEDGIRDATVTGVQTCALPISARFDGRFDNSVIDGMVNLVGNVTYAIGGWLRGAQTGFIRSYILFLALAAIVLFVPRSEERRVGKECGARWCAAS